MISGVSLAAVFAVGAFAAGSLAGIAPAAADPAQDKVISTYCNNDVAAAECNEWRYNRTTWSAAQYQSFYTAHQTDPAFQSAEAQAAFGLPVNSTASTNDVDPGTAPVKDPLGTAAIATPVSPSSDTPAASPAPAGTISSTSTGNVVNTVPEVIGDSPTHVADCQATFKSYDAATDTYMGLDGSREKCKL
jgi:hypothetical protein